MVVATAASAGKLHALDDQNRQEHEQTAGRGAPTVGRRQPADQPTDQPLGQPTSTRITPTAMIAIPAIMRGVSGSFQIARASSATSAIPTATQIPYATPTGIPADSAAARNANETR